MTHDASPAARPEARGYTRRQRWVNIAGLAVFGLLSIHRGHHVGMVMQEHGLSPGWILLAALLALPFADFLSGFVHWAADNWGRGDWPILGGFIQPFRNHHDDPLDMTRHGPIERHGDNCVASLPLFVAAFLAGPGPLSEVFWGSFWLASAYWIIATNQFHAWAHMDEVPGWVAWLQRHRLILSPEHHDRHHLPPHGEAYCITTGWMDAPLRWLRFFDLLDAIIERICGLPPRRRRGPEKAGVKPDVRPPTGSVVSR